MPHNEDVKNKLLTQLNAYAEKQLDAASFEKIRLFLNQYYLQLDAEDLQGRELNDLLGAVMSHFQLASRREPTAALVRVYNPRPEDAHAWKSDYTVVELVNADMPFLVDSVSMEINRHGLKLHLIVHPQMRVVRDKAGNLLKVIPLESKEADSQLESFIHIEIDSVGDATKRAELENGLQAVLTDVRHSVQDWQAMRTAIQECITSVGKAPYGAEEVAETRAFLEWVLNNHFTLLGYRECDLEQRDGQYMLRPVKGSSLGVLRSEPEGETRVAIAPAQTKAVLDDPHVLLLTKANTRATVHRPGHLDYIGIKRFDNSGKVIGEARLIGLYTSNVYSVSPHDIPLLRRKVASVVKRADFLPISHLEKTLLSILETYPRDELIEISEEDLYNTAMGILRLQERQRTRLFVRRDLFGRFYSCFVYLPRDKFNTETRLKIQRVLMHAFNGVSSEFTPQLSESILARIHFMIRSEPGTVGEVDLKALEAEIEQITRGWQDEFGESLAAQQGGEKANKVFEKYANAFPLSYREDYRAEVAVQDVARIEQLSAEQNMVLDLYAPKNAEQGALRLKLFHRGDSIQPSNSVPMLERLGVKVVDERAYRIDQEGQEPIWIHDIGLKAAVAGELDIHVIKPLFQDLFIRAWKGEVESDDFNRLVIGARLAWREIVVLRAYAKYFKQINLQYSQSYIEETLAAYPKIAALLVKLFSTRFDPLLDSDRSAATQVVVDALLGALENVSNLDQDQILRQYMETINATLRTNFYQAGRQGEIKSYISFKFDPAKIPNLPQPKPMFEIFVYSPRIEGVHLRGGKVARGGLRWSDRREDFRTEVLGLVKAQMVKNTVIVPVGSKGGFFVKNSPPSSDREAWLAEGIECYKTFLRGLLDVTDNLAGGQVVPPQQVVRHDVDDPYLVVAADKGTATFSDIANGISAEYNFWLGDAFASGGGNGYDHKKMGITARGAWESVKRNFRELGHDTQKEDFTVVGVGDMSGDVFGNGMLLSQHIRLLAAFDHRHIFIDPSPDAAQSFKERERMFALPRSSWEDYDKSLISKGGGIWPLSAKTIPLSPEARAVLGIHADKLTPNELKSAILKAPVDLLYNGGIGTYIKASTETHQQVGDRSNDAIRINGNDLRCKVLAEGGNLGATQLGRVEAAQAGVKLFTDAIDNSAGVDCSDHEVNIKILLNSLVAAGRMSLDARNELLAEMTDEVGHLVLQDNYYQTQCISIMTRRGTQLLEGQARMIRALEATGRLNRKLEYLPSDEEISRRMSAKKGFTAPENAVLLAYAKMALFDALVASRSEGQDFLLDPFFKPVLQQYFPQPLQNRFAQDVEQHPLKREIVATVLVNTILNRMGSTFVHFSREETGSNEAEILTAYILASEVFGLNALWQQIDAMDNQIADTVQGQILIDLTRFAQRATFWFLRHRQAGNLQEVIARFQPGVTELKKRLGEFLCDSEKQAWSGRVEAMVAQGVSREIAQTIAGLEQMLPYLDLVEVAQETHKPVDVAAHVYYALDSRLNHGWLRNQISRLPTDTHWQSLARASLRDDLAWRQRGLTASVLKNADSKDNVDNVLARWETQNEIALTRSKDVFSNLQMQSHVDLAMLSVAMRELRNMI